MLATLPVTYGDLNGWQLTASDGSPAQPAPSAVFENGPAAPPAGMGSLEFRISAAGSDAAQARLTTFHNTLLSDLTALSYSTYVDQNNSGQAPYIILNIDLDGDPGIEDLLFFEPVYQTGAYSGDPVPNQGTVTTGVWQTWDARAGGWWSLNASTFGPPLVTLDSYVAANPTARIINSSTGLGGIRLVTGFGGPGDWGNFIGNADAFTIGVSGSDTTYDFGAPPDVVYVDDDWTGTTAGDDPDGAGPAQSFGFDSFATIQGGVNGVATNGTVNVAAGTYSELVQVNKTVALLGAQAGVDARTRPFVPANESVVNGSGGSFSVTADNVVLDGFTVEGTTGGPLGTGIHVSAATSGQQILNNIIQDNVIGLYLNSNGVTQTVVEHNLIRDNNNPGAAGGTGIYSDSGLSNVLIQENRIAGDNPTAGMNLIGASGVTVSSNFFEDGNQLVLFNFDGSAVNGNQFSGSLSPASDTGTAVFIGGGSNALAVTGNTFTDRPRRAIIALDSGFGFGGNSDLTIADNTITQNVGVLLSSTAMIDLRDVGGASTVSGNAISLSGSVAGAVTFVHGIDVRGALTGTLAISNNSLNGGNVDTFDGSLTSTTNSSGIFIRSGTGGSLSLTENTFMGWVNGIQSDDAAAGNSVNDCNHFLGNSNAGLLHNGGGTLDAEGNFWGNVTGPTNPGNPGGTGDKVFGNVDFSPWAADAACTVLIEGESTATLQDDPCEVGEKALVVVGTSTKDKIEIKRKGSTGNIEVKINNQTSTFAETDFVRIIVYGLAGDDHIKVQDKVLHEAWLFGGDGNDHLQAGGGSSILEGNDGDDHLQGGKLRDLLIGGDGKDKLESKGDDDILIAGFTDHDDDLAALCAIMDGWNAGTEYNVRVAALSSLLNDTTVHDDGDEDKLEGGPGLDWFFANLDGDNGAQKDKVSGAKSGEQVDDIDV